MNITYDNEILERFIPVAYDELFVNVVEHFNLNDDAHKDFSSRLRFFYHTHFHKDLITLKRLYLPFNPDADTVTLKRYSPTQYETIKAELVSKIKPLLNSANYEELTESTLREAMNKTSPYGVEVSVDFDDFEDISLFFRGEAHRYDEKRTLSSLYLKKEKFRVDVYRRLFILLKPKTLQERAREIAKRDGEDLKHVTKRLRKNNLVLIEGEKKERIYIKLFKDIPHADLEMLFPNTKVKMTFQDKLKIGITGGGGTIGGLATLITKLGSMIEPLSLITAVGVFGGVLWRQIKTIFTHRTRYMATLAKNLYFYNLDNNAGVLTHMIDMAENEESKEALLAYIFIAKSEQELNREALDREIEAYMLQYYNIPMNFEVDDGVKKLLELGLIKESRGVLHAVEVEKAKEFFQKNS